MIIVFFPSGLYVRVSSLAGKVSLWGCGDISPSCRTRKRLQFEKVPLTSVPASSTKTWRCISLQFVWLELGFCVPKGYEDPTAFIYSAKLQTPRPPRWCGFNHEKRQGQNRSHTSDWFDNPRTSISLVSLPSICQTPTNCLCHHRPIFPIN